MRRGHPSPRVSGVAVGRNQVFHHEGHEGHEEEGEKEAFCPHDSPSIPGNSHSHYLCAFASLRAIRQKVYMPRVTDKAGEALYCPNFFLRVLRAFVVKNFVLTISCL